MRVPRWVAILALLLAMLCPVVFAKTPRSTPAIGNNLLRDFLKSLRDHWNVLEHIEENPDGVRNGAPGYHLWATYQSAEHVCMATGQGPLTTTDWDCINISDTGDRTAGVFCGATLSTSMDCEQFLPRIAQTCVIQRVDAAVRTAPTGASVIVDVNECSAPDTCTSIWSATPANRVTVAATAKTGSQTSFDDTSLAAGNYLDFDVDQVGSTTAGADLTVTVTCRPGS